MQSGLIKAALERGILSQEQAEALRNLSAEIAGGAGTARNNIIAPRDDEPARPKDDEDLKFVGGFGDILVTIGLGLFLGALAYFAGKSGGDSSLAASLMTGIATWILAEYFTRKRRMALPSIVMLLIFIYCCFIFFASLFSYDIVGGMFRTIDRAYSGRRWVASSELIAPCLATAVLAVIYYWRFRVPVAVAGAAAVLGGAVVSLISAISPEFAIHYARYITLFYGLVVFALAMRFDMSDTLRRTRRTDIAFWLHLLAAPLIVHPTLDPLASGKTLTGEQAVLIIAVFLSLGIVAIVIDRRALIASGLIYAGISFAALIKGTGLASFASESVPVTLITLGGFILLISAGWHPVRRVILGWLPAGFTRHLYNPYALEAAH